MSETNSSTHASRDKPTKPYTDFPLFAHAAGVWAKKIRGKLHYFGKWDDLQAALDKYLKEKDDLHAGRTPRPNPEALTLKALADEFLYAKKDMMDAGELSPRTWDGYKSACILLVRQFGKTRLVADLGPDDFAALRSQLAKRYGPHGLGTAIQCIRCALKYAFDAGLIDRPIRYGPHFKRPSKKTLRLHKAKQGPKLFAAAEVRALVQGALVVGKDGPGLVQASAQLRAMILLGINAGFGNADCGRLPLDAVDLERGVIDYPRPKTGIPRRCPLWPETVAALREVLAKRQEPRNPELAGLMFLTQRGLSWAKDTNDCPLAKETAKLLYKLGIKRRKGLGFYTLRHTFRTVADEARDQPAADCIMGHEVDHMSTVYREKIGDKRLKAVSDFVRDWLFGAGTPSAGQTTDTQ
jgi:integrase